MKAVVLSVLACLVAASANPFVETFVNEIRTAADGDWVEFSVRPNPSRSHDLHGWTLQTSTTLCTLDFFLGAGEHVVIDSTSIANGVLGHGTFALRPDTDFIVLRDTGWLIEEVHYPAEVGPDGTLAPGLSTSASRHNVHGFVQQCNTWYLDSTPTLADTNDDYGVVSGTVRGSGGEQFLEFIVRVTGENGYACASGYRAYNYRAGGLNPGRYQVKARGWIGSVMYEATYPDSVVVGYSTEVTGIDIVIPVSGIRESGAAREPALLGPGLLLDVSGRRVMELRRGANDVRGVRPGIYFIRREQDDYTHKVVVQR